MKKPASVTDIGSVRSVLYANYEKNQTTMPFPKALSLALLSETRKTDTFCYPEYSGFLSCKDFWDYVGRIPVFQTTHPSPISHPQNITGRFGNFYLQEDSLFTEGMDINVYTHLPFVNDGFHTHDHFELNYIYHGNGDFYSEDEHLTLKEGAFLIIAPDSPHNIRAFKDDFIISIMVRKSTFNSLFWSLLSKDTLLSAFFRNALKQNNEKNYMIFQTENEWLLQNYLQNLFAELGMKDAFYNHNMTSILLLFFSTLLRNHSDTAHFYNCQQLSGEHCDFNLLSQYIRQNYNTITLKDVAEKFHYSESFFSKLIKKNFGVSFSVLIRDLRLSHAHELLRHSSYTLREICDIVGYQSVSAFSRSYKKRYGTSPGSHSQSTADSFPRS